MAMTRTELTLAVAAVAALAALASVVIAGTVALMNEAKRRRDARHAEELKELRAWTAQVFQHLFELQHETEWITWHALHHPQTVDRKMISAYEAAVHAAFPKLLGAMAVVAAVDEELFTSLKQQADALYDLEGRVALAAISIPEDEALARLASMNGPARGFYEALPERLAHAMREAKVQPQT